MKLLYLDCRAGISGDMTVGALLDLGVPLEHLRAELSRLGLPPGSYELATARTERNHVMALKFDVAVHDHHTHRSYADISAMIAASSLSGRVREISGRIFLRLAEAEARVHGVTVAEVHFHEVGAVDSIVDIVGTAICLEYLGVERLQVSALPLGSGFVETAHGRLPIPAPATAELLKGLAVHMERGPGERVTPTGAAIVATLAESGSGMPVMRLERVGCGAGSKVFADCPNILRAFLGEIDTGVAGDAVLVVETNIDDSTPEILGYAMEQLLEAGALDVWFTPIQMKKGRPAVTLSFLCRPEQLNLLAALTLKETTAIGMRHYPAGRIVLQRNVEEKQTRWGEVRFKRIYGPDGALLRETPEYDDCRRIARKTGLPCRDVMESLMHHGDKPE